jgi:hypothetical protein
MSPGPVTALTLAECSPGGDAAALLFSGDGRGSTESEYWGRGPAPFRAPIARDCALCPLMLPVQPGYRWCAARRLRYANQRAVA